jgi:hypothetical protein
MARSRPTRAREAQSGRGCLGIRRRDGKDLETSFRWDTFSGRPWERFSVLEKKTGRCIAWRCVSAAES